jgi:hypothetical protein
VPSIVSKRRAKNPSAAMPPRLARAYKPEIVRDTIPWHPTLDTGQPPYSGEIREEMIGSPVVSLAPVAPQIHTIVVLATLRRPWNYIGFAVDPRAFGGVAGIGVGLRVLTRLGPALMQSPAAIPLAGVTDIVAATNYIVGAPCELVFVNASGASATVRGCIWGMSDH